MRGAAGKRKGRALKRACGGQSRVAAIDSVAFSCGDGAAARVCRGDLAVAGLPQLSAQCPELPLTSLLYRTAVQCKVIDFAMDHLGGEGEAHEAAEKYKPQPERYRQAVRALLGREVEGQLCSSWTSEALSVWSKGSMHEWGRNHDLAIAFDMRRKGDTIREDRNHG